MFQGFTPETIRFLEGIRDNNNKEWFEANKDRYKKELYYPLKECAQALFVPFAKNKELLLRVSTIYRDAQCAPFTHYREYLWICIRRDTMHWARKPTLFLSISATGVSYGFTMWTPEPRFMERFREEISERPARFLAILKEAEEKSGLTLSGKEYKRPKPGFTPENERFFRMKNFEMFGKIPVGKAVYAKNLPQKVSEKLLALEPLMEYFYELENREPTPHRVRSAEEFEW